MIVAWVGLVVVVAALLMALPATSTISEATWPGETPLSLHDNRARDPHLRHLARILGSESSLEAHRTIQTLTEDLLASSTVTLFEGSADARARLGPRVAAFLSESPPKDHHQFLRDLGEVVTRIESL